MSMHSNQRDVFLSHRSVDKTFVRQLAGDIEVESFQGRNLLTWLDEAEIRPGQSIPGMINEGLEKSRFIGLVMTPDYFHSKSGWTEAEWHAALYTDPDNRKAHILPLLVADCPYIPYLLRHLKAIDFRADNYPRALKELLAVLRDEPLPRPIAHRGQLVTPGGRIDRATLVAERAVPQAYPDAISERSYCNLLPVERLPQYVYTAPISRKLLKVKRDGTEALPSKQEIKDTIRADQEAAQIEHPFIPAFRVIENRIVTFHDLKSSEGALASVIDDADVQVVPTINLLSDEEERKLVISLLNMCLERHANRVGLVIDTTKQGRFYFPPKDGGANVITWTPNKKKACRTVAKPCTHDGQVKFWRHLGAYLKIMFLANKFYLQVRPTWVITEDGIQVRQGSKVGRLVIKWTGAERNLQVLYHVRFWATVLRAKQAGPILLQAGDQCMEISTVPAFIEQAYGIADDQKNLMEVLDQEALLLAETEEQLADQAVEVELAQAEDEDIADEEESSLKDLEEEDYLDDE